MNDTKPYPVLDYVVNLIKNTISDAKVEYTSIGTVTLKDGNDTIYLEQKFDSSESLATIFITDPKEIIYSEDLLVPLKNLAKGTDGPLKSALQDATIIVNDLDLETYLIFLSVKNEFDQLSNSYEFLQTVEKETTKVKSLFKFGKHPFGLNVVNEADQILLTTKFASTIDPGIKKTIEEDALKVQAQCMLYSKKAKL